MGKKEQKDHHSVVESDDKVEAVLHLLRKHSPLTLKQEKFCNRACVGRFLRIKGDNVKKAAKQLRSCLSWRSSLGIESLIADEFTAELAEGLAYVAGLDDECRPVLVAISTMSRNVEQFVILFDAIAAAVLLVTLIVLFSFSLNVPLLILCNSTAHLPFFFFFFIYKTNPKLLQISISFHEHTCDYTQNSRRGIRTFVDLSTATMIVSMQDFQDSFDYDDFSSSYPSRVSSLRFDTSSLKSTDKIGSCASSRFAFTVSRDGLDTVKPWCLTLTDTSSTKLGHNTGAYISPLNARSFSFASPAARSEPFGGPRRSFFASTPMPARTTDRHSIGTLRDPRIPRPSFFQSPAIFFRRESHVSKSEKPRDSFVQFLKFYRRPYDEMTYRSKMRPPLGGLVSIVSTQIRRRHVSLSQRF
uniref:YUP8H12.1 n=1 Tax=Arabidopsis thaliana TaxID=3702 RepID=O23032_ARATH|nr:YUP8H12.1 [Arabidopsis thaliana]